MKNTCRKGSFRVKFAEDKSVILSSANDKNSNCEEVGREGGLCSSVGHTYVLSAENGRLSCTDPRQQSLVVFIPQKPVIVRRRPIFDANYIKNRRLRYQKKNMG
jgi:hypothetical protein